MNEIRPAAASDLGRMAEIYAYYVEETPATFDLIPPTREEWHERLALAGANRHPWYVALTDGDVSGFALTGAFRPKAAYDSTLESSIYLDPRHVGAGIGSELYAACLAQAAANGFHVAVAGITVPNDLSVALHHKIGFEPVGMFAEVGHKFGEWRDVSWWQLRLARYGQGS